MDTVLEIIGCLVGLIVSTLCLTMILGGFCYAFYGPLFYGRSARKTGLLWFLAGLTFLMIMRLLIMGL